MLKNVPPIVPPELLKVLSEMGHGDEIVIADGNFPSESVNNRVIRMDGHGGKEILRAVLQLIPLDTFAKENMFFMEKVPGDECPVPIWKEYEEIAGELEGDRVRLGFEERFAFYERSRHAYAVIASGETALYANVLLKKGVIVP